MKCLSVPECQDWTALLGLSQGGRREGFPAQVKGKSFQTAYLKIPDSCRRQALGINYLFNTYKKETQWLLWLRGWSSWPYESYPEVWNQVRQRHGEDRPLIEAPGHLFSWAEKDLAAGMTRLAMLFGWDALLVSEPVAILATMTNDEELYIFARTPRALRKVTSDLEPYFPPRGPWIVLPGPDSGERA